MSADQLLYPMEFDSLFPMAPENLGSNSTSVDSVSPRELEQSFTDADFTNWESDSVLFSQAMFPDFAGLDAPVPGLDQSLDFESFINPNDVLQPMPLSQPQFAEPSFETAWLPDADYASSFRYMVESQAALDTRAFSQKEKRRDASIALHMQRMQNAPLPDPNTPSLSSNHLSSPNWSESSLDFAPIGGSSPNMNPASESQQSSPASEPGAASMQLVLDLNMNTTANVPKKQKPRSKAQRENYIKARKYGVCEKHRKQHKRCNCLEKAAAAGLSANASRVGTNTIAGPQTNHERIMVNKSPQRSVQSPTSSTESGLSRPLRQPVTVPAPDLLPTRPLVSPGGDQVTRPRALQQPVRVSRPDLSPTQALAPTGREHVAVRQTVKLQKPNVSLTGSEQTMALPTSHNRSQTSGLSRPAGLTRSIAQSASLLVIGRGSLETPAAYRDKNSKSTLQSGLRTSDSRRTPRQLADARSVVASRGGLNVRQVQNTTPSTAVTRNQETARSSTNGLLSLWESSLQVSLSSWTSWKSLASSASSFLGRLAISSSRFVIQARIGMGLLS
ncbi:uncharacterized protein BDV14DRAFT_185751 [Aspergillus stella-maris]|uniref:uncharacterized protein n=1 Tax=Aspergillus stella-maris TaxID=1810926 RepID=UPI003CCD7750